MSRDEKIVMVLKRVLPVMSILTVFVFVMLINKKSYALFHKRIETDITIHISTADKLPFTPGPANDVIKDTIGKEGGITGLDPTTGGVCSNGECKEYRYSGSEVNNYIYFNCSDGTTYQTAKSNCEKWRIVGVFKDESGEEHLKIVRNEILNGIFPETFEANGITYKIKGITDTTAYWNSLNPTSYSEQNDWSTAGLQYWLNAGSDKEAKEPSDGYMSYLSKNAKKMIKATKYYLGTVTYKYSSGSYKIQDTPKEAYANERDVESCIENTGNDANISGCKVWGGNEATWSGNVSLLYPSDYGFSASSDYWETILGVSSFNENVSDTSWLKKITNQDITEYLLSPSSDRSYSVTYLSYDGYVGSNDVISDSGVRPTLNLISEVKIISGDGSSATPYFLSLN